MKVKSVLLFVAAALSVMGCAKDEIEEYKLEDCAVYFPANSISFSVKGMTEETRSFSIPVVLVGRVADYKRPITLEVKDDNASRGSNYEIVSSQIDSGATSGAIVIRVNKLPSDVESRSTRFTIVPNDYFRAGPPKRLSMAVVWSAEYERPSLGTWRYWWLYFSKSYSKNLHKLYVEILGEEAEHYTASKSYVTTEGCEFKMPTWWYEASRKVYNTVREHDAAHPEAPYMHSEDVQIYSGFGVAAGEGTKPATVPTILETLVIL